ncbi:MAG: hypothetical protein NVS1B9_12310 [Solirubrobacteraceae bacterium]
MRATGASAYRDGRGAFTQAPRRIVAGHQLGGHHTIDVDACVIGSGAGGAPMAMELAEGGMRVAVLEDGEWWDTDRMNARPREMMRMLYRDGGQTVALGRPPIPLPLGRAVGGTTILNSGTCFRTPDHVLERWRSEVGLAEFTPAELDPYFRRVERILNVCQVPAELAGRNAQLVREGAEQLGYHGDWLYRNVRGCVGSGVCAYGCPTGAKQHTGITFMPRAWAAGATLYTGARAVELKPGSVRARTAAGGELRINCGSTIVACGALLSPALLRASGIDAPALGGNLTIHPACAVRARFDEPVNQWDGVPQSYHVDEWARERVILEAIAGPPDHIAMTTPRRGAAHRELMLDAARTAMFGVMVCDESRGVVRRHAISYTLCDADTERFKFGIERLTAIYWAAGAREVIVPVAGIPTLRGGDSGPLERARLRAPQLKLMGFHPLGTTRAGADPASSVVDPSLQVHGHPGLYVCDGGVVPSPPGVNPQITIMALASRAAFGILGRAAPVNEPHPEAIA